MRLPARSRTAVLLASVLVAGGLMVPVQGAVAGPEDRKRKVDASIDVLKDDLDDTSAALVAAFTALQKTQGRLPAARRVLVEAQSAEAAAAERDREVASALAVSLAAEAKAVDDLAGTAQEAEATSNVLGAIARQAYQSAGMGELSVALQAQSADDFATRVVLVDTAMRIQGDALARLAVLRSDTTAARARLTAVRQQTALLRAQAAANLVTAEQVAQAAVSAKNAVDELVAQQSDDVATVEARKEAEKKRLAALEAQSRQLQAQLAEIARQARLKAARDRAARAAAQARAARRAEVSRSGNGGGDSSSGGGFASGGYLSVPVSGAYVSSEFGMRFHPILQYWRLHAGIDFAVGCGTPVRAPDNGRVVSAGWAGGYGNRIVVDHGLVGDVGLATSYNHLERIVVSGGSVNRGDLIGYVGTTGSSTGCHLHFETYEDGTPVNPRRWL